MGSITPDMMQQAQAQMGNMRPEDWERAKQQMSGMSPEEMGRQAQAAGAQMSAQQQYLVNVSRQGCGFVHQVLQLGNPSAASEQRREQRIIRSCSPCLPPPPVCS